MTEMPRQSFEPPAQPGRPAEEEMHGLILVEIDDFAALEELYGESVASGVIYGAETSIWPILPKGSGTWHAARGQFAISMPSATLEALGEIAAKVQAAIASTPHAAPQGALSITACAGVAVAPASTLMELGPAARRALTNAQALGRGRRSAKRAGDDATALRHRRAERAIYANDVHIVFQPIEKAHGGAPVAWYECFARLPNEGAPLDNAADFVPHLVRTGHAPALDRLMLERAAALMTGRPLLRLSLNVAAPTLADQGYADRLQALCAADLTLGDRLILEIDAATALAEPAVLRQFIDRLRKTRAALAFDNIAAKNECEARGEIALLTDYRPDFVKVPFHEHEPAPPHRGALIAQALGLDASVVATYLQSPAQMVTAKALGAHFLQGWAVAGIVDTISGAAAEVQAPIIAVAPREVVSAEQKRAAG